MLEHSWPVLRHVAAWIPPEEYYVSNNSIATDAADATDVAEAKETANTIDVAGDSLSTKEWSRSLFRITEVNVHYPIIDWDASSTRCSQSNKH